MHLLQAVPGRRGLFQAVPKHFYNVHCYPRHAQDFYLLQEFGSLLVLTLALFLVLMFSLLTLSMGKQANGLSVVQARLSLQPSTCRPGVGLVPALQLALSVASCCHLGQFETCLF